MLVMELVSLSNAAVRKCGVGTLTFLTYHFTFQKILNFSITAIWLKFYQIVATRIEDFFIDMP